VNAAGEAAPGRPRGWLERNVVWVASCLGLAAAIANGVYVCGMLGVWAMAADPEAAAAARGAKQVQPQVVRQAPPVYPADLRSRGVTGRVTVTFVVDVRGVPVDVTVADSSDPLFNAPAIAAVQEWRFKPGTIDGRPVNTRMSVPILFHIEDAVTKPTFEAEAATATPALASESPDKPGSEGEKPRAGGDAASQERPRDEEASPDPDDGGT